MFPADHLTWFGMHADSDAAGLANSRITNPNCNTMKRGSLMNTFWIFSCAYVNMSSIEHYLLRLTNSP